jgi:IclR family transcriptional regulator, KDG regulon repressor
MIQVINRTFDILDLMSESNQVPLTLSHIADTLGLHRATCANILRTLVERGIVEKSSQPVGYRLGPSLFTLTGGVGYEEELVRVSESPLRELSSRIEETALLGVMRNDTRLILLSIEYSRELLVRPGERMALYESAMGRVMLAHLSESEIQRFVRRNGYPTKQVWEEGDRELFRSALAKMHETGYEIRQTKHVTGIGMPIVKDGRCVAGLGVALASVSWNPKRRKFILDEMRKTRLSIEDGLRE